MLYESLAGRVPFSGATLPAILRAAARNKYAPLPAGVSGECRDLVAALLRPDPARRITLERGLQHPWLRQGPGCSRQLSPVPSAEAAGVAGSRAGSVVVQSRPGSAARGSSQGGAGRLQSQDSTACQQRSSLSLLLPVAEEDGSLAALALAGSGSGSGERDAPPAGARGGRPRSPAAVPGKSSAGVPRRTSSNKPAGADPSSPARCGLVQGRCGGAWMCTSVPGSDLLPCHCPAGCPGPSPPTLAPAPSGRRRRRCVRQRRPPRAGPACRAPAAAAGPDGSMECNAAAICGWRPEVPADLPTWNLLIWTWRTTLNRSCCPS